MKRKIVCSFLILIIAVMCCACSNEVIQKGSSNYDYSNSQEEYEKDIRYKKDADDHSPTVYITKSGKRYHKPYCSHAKNVYITLTVRQACDKGYTACYYCCY